MEGSSQASVCHKNIKFLEWKSYSVNSTHTNYPLEKMATISRMIFVKAFREWKILYIDFNIKISLKFIPAVSHWQ